MTTMRQRGMPSAEGAEGGAVGLAAADPAVTYSGHKGKGYEVQVAETCESGNAVQMITHVEVTPSSGSDSVVTTRVIDELSERG